MSSIVQIEEQTENIAMITINRPHVMNSLNDELAKELLAALEKLENNCANKVIVLQGAGQQFMAGGDIHFFAESLHYIKDKANQMIETVHRITEIICNSSKLYIASVHGAVAGIGLSFMLACDLVIASEKTKFTTSYTKLGASPDGGLTHFLPRLVGHKKAMKLLLFSDLISSEEALELGLINWMVKEEERQQKTMEIAEYLTNGPTVSFQSIKKLLLAAENNTLKEQLDLEKQNFVQAASSQDFSAGVSAFITKQKPLFTGK